MREWSECLSLDLAVVSLRLLVVLGSFVWVITGGYLNSFHSFQPALGFLVTAGWKEWKEFR